MFRFVCGALLLAFVVVGCTPSVTHEAPPAPAASVDAPPVDASPPALPPGVGTLGETRYSCGSQHGFLPGLLDEPAIAELEDHPSAAALRAAIAEVGPDIDMLPASGYWLVHRDDRVAEYIARDPAGADPDHDLVFASTENEGGAWKNGGWGGCRPEIVIEGLNLATWTLDPDVAPPDATATTFTALVMERSCTGGKPMGARLQPPSITYGQDSILIVFAARPLEGDSFDCPGNPSTRVIVQLREALGDRRLLDAAFFPPADPIAPEF
jgi:hypothetical protein